MKYKLLINRIKKFMSMVTLSAVTLSHAPIVTSYEDVENIKKIIK